MVVARQLNIVTLEGLKQNTIERRKNKVISLVEAGLVPDDIGRQAIDTFERGKIPYAQVAGGFDPKKHLNLLGGNGRVAEFTGASAGKFASGFFTRLRQEVQNGREEVPLLFESLYNVMRDESIAETETIYTFSDDDIGVVFNKIEDGGEVQFVRVGGGEKSIYQVQYARGIEYTKRLFKFGSFFRMAAIERAFGRAANALQNHVHFQPILNNSYVTRNQTDGTSLTKFNENAALAEKYHVTLEEAIQHSRDDDTFHRPGPYILLCANSDLMTVRKALENPEQRGISKISPEVMDQIQTVIGYRGWTGSDGNGSVTYPGVTAGKAYLIDTSRAEFDYQSMYSQDLEMIDVGADHARFVVERYLWDMFFGVFAAPERSVEEITWPTGTDGADTDGA